MPAVTHLRGVLLRESRIGGSVRFQWKLDSKSRSRAGHALHSNGPAKRGADRFHNRQTQARASKLAGSCAIDSIESLKHVRNRFLWNAHSGI